jgi:hypothetical protein
MNNSITGLPAYGRDYKSKAAVVADWIAGKDFKDALSGKYFSVRDKIPEVWIRYDKIRKIIRVN